MRLTDEMIQEDDKRFTRQDLLAEFNYCGKEVPKRKSITNDDIRFYAWLCRSAYARMKEQEEEIENLKQTAQSMMEGICLLKEQEAVKPTWGRGRPFCGACGSRIRGGKFCSECGKPILWKGR